MKLRIAAVNFRPTDRYADEFERAVVSVARAGVGETLLVFSEYTFLPALLKALDSNNPLPIVARARDDLLSEAGCLAKQYRVHILVCGAELSASGIRNLATLFDSQGNIAHQTLKNSLTAWERQLGIVPGDLSATQTYDLAGRRLGVAICLDAFSDPYRQRLAEQGTEIMLMPSANPQRWAAAAPSGVWQPMEWTEATVGSLRFGAIRSVVNPMLQYEGDRFLFDGQGSITERAQTAAACPYTGDANRVIARFSYCETVGHTVGSVDM